MLQLVCRLIVFRSALNDKSVTQGKKRYAVTDLKIHLVCITKYRRSVLTSESLALIEKSFKEVAKKMGFQIQEFNGEPDHIHVLIEQEMTRGRGDTGTRSVKCSEAASGCGASRGHSPPLKEKLSVAPLQVESESPSVMSPRHRVTPSPRPLQFNSHPNFLFLRL